MGAFFMGKEKIMMNEKLRKDYEKLWATIIVKHNDRLEIIIKRILAKKSQYQAVELSSGVPWYVVACIHYMEASLDFKRQIHNGQRWDRKTTLVPKGKGPWRTWHESAVDAMKKLNEDMLEELGEFFQWDIPSICYAFEDHNGWGYRNYHKQVKSPYLWSFSNHYKSGKYVADGRWSGSAVSKQLGTMVIIVKLKKSMEPVVEINLSDLGVSKLIIPEPKLYKCNCGATSKLAFTNGMCEDCFENRKPPQPKKRPWWKFWC